MPFGSEIREIGRVEEIQRKRAERFDLGRRQPQSDFS